MILGSMSTFLPSGVNQPLQRVPPPADVWARWGKLIKVIKPGELLSHFINISLHRCSSRSITSRTKITSGFTHKNWIFTLNLLLSDYVCEGGKSFRLCQVINFPKCNNKLFVAFLNLKCQVRRQIKNHPTNNLTLVLKRILYPKTSNISFLHGVLIFFFVLVFGFVKTIGVNPESGNNPVSALRFPRYP